MNSAFDLLPPDAAAFVPLEWRKNEADYWAVRDQLLVQHKNQWIGFADGKVVASGTSPVAVFHEAEEKADAPFVTCVGHENEPTRMRRTSFPYDKTYPGEPLPILQVEFRTSSGSPGIIFDHVIADTGADATALPWADCQKLKLKRTGGRVGWIGGVAGSSAPTVVFRMWVQIDGQEYPCRLQADFVGTERLLGREVLNRMVVTFDGPAGEVIVNP